MHTSIKGHKSELHEHHEGQLLVYWGHWGHRQQKYWGQKAKNIKATEDKDIEVTKARDIEAGKVIEVPEVTEFLESLEASAKPQIHTSKILLC